MNISPRSGKPKLTVADRQMVERFSKFASMLIYYKDEFNTDDIGKAASAAKTTVVALLDAVTAEMPTPKPTPKPNKESGDAADTATDAVPN